MIKPGSLRFSKTGFFREIKNINRKNGVIKLRITLKRQNRVLTVYLKGELDHHAVSKVKETIDLQLVKMPVSQLILDMSAVTFMDSSGVGLIVGRFNKMKSLGGSMKIKNPGFSILKVLQMSGLSRLMEIS